MFDTSIYNQGRSLESGLRAGTQIRNTINNFMDKDSVKQAAARIQAGEDQQKVISELMAKSPQAAQQLMNLVRGQQDVDAGVQEVNALKQKVGMQTLQTAALPIFGALMTDDEKSRGALLNESAAVFEKQSPETANVIRQLGTLKGQQQFDAIGGLVKTLRNAGVFPEDPSQMLGQGTALSQNLALYDQAIAAGDTEKAELIKRNIDPYSRSLAGGVGAGEARLMTEQALNPVLGQREAGKIQATEGTATGQAKLQQEQQAVAKGQSAVDAEKEQKSKALEASKEALRLTESIMNNPNLGSVTGVNALTYTVMPESQDLINQANQLLALLTAENLKLMSGVLSETDIKMLRDLSSGLNVSEKGIKGSEQAIRVRLTDIASKLRSTLQSKGAFDAQSAGKSPSSGEVVDWSNL